MNLILATSFIGLPVTDSENKKLGKVSQTLIDINNGVLIGLVIKKDFLSPAYFLDYNDIDDLYHSHVQVKKDSQVTTLKENKTAYTMHQHSRRLIGLLVVTKDGKKIGRLDDMAISLNMGLVIRFYVKSLFSDRIIDRENIVEITKKKIVVKDDLSYARQDKLKLPKIIKSPSLESTS
jgi:sporulation protein YlmC with PRC-barrel domain